MNIVVLIVLIGMILALFVDRFFQEKRLTTERKDWADERSRLLKAVMAKNINEYNSAVIADKVTVEIPEEPDEVLASEASDDTFYKHIKTQTQ